jgi:DegV family protein with EDD domain
MGEREYEDGKDLSIDDFYKLFLEEDCFPKTSLPNLDSLKQRVDKFTSAGDDVIFLTISSGISGTYSAIKTLFDDNNKVRVIDTKSAVGGIKILVKEINKHKDESLDEIETRLNKLIPRIKILAIPETLNYLLKGGRLSKKEWLFGTMLNIKPIIGIINGGVKVIDKKIGLKKAMAYLTEALKKLACDVRYPIVPSYTYNKENLDQLISMTDKEYHSAMIEYDNLDPAIACHWGPNAFGYIFVGKE